jgi:hypothetical protein
MPIHPVNRDGLLAVLDLPPPEIRIPKVHLPLYLAVYRLRNTDAARLGQSFEASGEVHGIAVWRIFIQENLTQVNPQPELHRRAGGRDALRSASSRWISTALPRAPVTLGKTARTLSPAMSTTRPSCRATQREITSRESVSRRTVPSSSACISRP